MLRISVLLASSSRKFDPYAARSHLLEEMKASIHRHGVAEPLGHRSNNKDQLCQSRMPEYIPERWLDITYQFLADVGRICQRDVKTTFTNTSANSTAQSNPCDRYARKS